MRCVAFSTAVLGLCLATTARAESSSSNKASAEALFREGKRLMTAGQYADACPKFEASQKLDPGVGTLLNLADCYEKVGKTASAWAEYREVIPLARQAGSDERVDLATSRANALEARLSTLTIRTSFASNEQSGTLPTIQRDGVTVDPAELGTAIPVDPGHHEITATAPGMKPWSTKFMVTGDGLKLNIEVPRLAPEGPGPGGPPPGNPGDARPPSPQKPIGIVVGAVGVVGLGIGAFFGVSASSTWKDAKGLCKDYPYECTGDALAKQDSASSKATVSTIAFIAGGAALAVGTVLWVTAPSSKSSLALGVGPGSVTARGHF